MVADAIVMTSSNGLSFWGSGKSRSVDAQAFTGYAFVGYAGRRFHRRVWLKAIRAEPALAKFNHSLLASLWPGAHGGRFAVLK